MQHFFMNLKGKLKERQRKIQSLLSRQSIAKTVDAKDSYTRQHSTRVAKFSREIAKRSGLFSQEQIEIIYRTALLHDIGKIGIRDDILNKKARLTDAEFEIMKTHTTIGAQILADVTLIKDVDKGINPVGFDDIENGSLFGKYRVLNDEVWADVKAGKFKGFSIEGYFGVIESKFIKQKNHIL